MNGTEKQVKWATNIIAENLIKKIKEQSELIVTTELM